MGISRAAGKYRRYFRAENLALFDDTITVDIVTVVIVFVEEKDMVKGDGHASLNERMIKDSITTFELQLLSLSQRKVLSLSHSNLLCNGISFLFCIHGLKECIHESQIVTMDRI